MMFLKRLLPHLFRRRFSVNDQQFCSSKPSTATAINDGQGFRLPAQVLPSGDLLGKLDRNTKDKLARRLLEMEFLYSISTEVPNRLRDSNWIDLCEISTAGERERYVRSIYFHEMARQKVDAANAEMSRTFQEHLEEDRLRFERGEMVYGNEFHSLYGCFRGIDCRRMMDRMYGCRVWAAHRVDEQLPKLVIDCRNLYRASTLNIYKIVKQIQQLYDLNWSARNPFEIVVANFLVDKVIGRAIRKYWYFLFGPPSSRQLAESMNDLPPQVSSHFIVFPEEDVENNERPLVKTSAGMRPLEDAQAELWDLVDGGADGRMAVEELDRKFVPHPLGPRITTLDIWDALGEGVEPDEVAYLSPRANRFLDTKVPGGSALSSHSAVRPLKAFVIAAYEDPSAPWLQSLAMAFADRLPAYRLPLEKYLVCGSGVRFLSMLTVVRVLSAVVNDGERWVDALQRHVTAEYRKAEGKSKFSKKRQELRIANLERRSDRVRLLKEMSERITERHINLLPERARMPASEWRSQQKKRAVHRYSREERNAMRQIKT